MADPKKKELDEETTPDAGGEEKTPEAGGEEEVVEKTEVVVDEEVTKELVSQVEKMIDAKLEAKAEKEEKVIDKNINGGGTPEVKSDLEKMAKEIRLFKHLKAFRTKDFAEVGRFNKYSIETNVKAGYMNEGTNADGGFLVPDADFIAEVARLEEEYGVARRNARLWETNSDSVKMNKKASGVTMYETGEAVAKTGTKMTFGQDEVSLRKFAAIAIWTDELNEDSAVNLFNELTTDFAREKARIEDVLVFTDSTTGIVNQAGVNIVSVGSSINDITFDDLNEAIYGVPTQSMNGGKFYLHRKILSVIQKIKDQNDLYIWSPGPNGSVNGTIWGYPYELVEVLPSADAANESFIVFGNLKYSTLIMKRGLQLKELTEATVTDSEDNEIHLAEQDASALRAVCRLNNKVQFPAAFSVIGTGTVS